MKMVKRTRLPSQQVNGTTDLADEYIGEGEDHAMSFDLQDTADLAVSNVVTASAHATQNGIAASTFTYKSIITDNSQVQQAPSALTPRFRVVKLHPVSASCRGGMAGMT